jgi:DNA-binding FadR family transcriptional regulator
MTILLRMRAVSCHASINSAGMTSLPLSKPQPKPHRKAGSPPVRDHAPHKSRAKGNANDFLAAALGGEIVAGVYAPGERLPSEASLLDRFKVSRPTLREAFRTLAAKGLIASRQKVGAIVRPRSDWNALDPEFLSWHLRTALSKNFVNDLFQLRQMVEPQAAFLAARSRDAAALEAITAAYDQMETGVAESEELLGADLRFHQAILNATGNLFVGALGGLIDTALLGSFRLSWRVEPARSDRLHQHRAVLEAIRAQKPEEARDRMAALLRDSVGDVQLALDKSIATSSP